MLATHAAYETSMAVLLPGVIVDGLVFFVSQEKLAELGMPCQLLVLGSMPAEEAGRKAPENARRLREVQDQAKAFFQAELSKDLGAQARAWQTFAFGLALPGDRFQGVAVVHMKTQQELTAHKIQTLLGFVEYCGQRFAMERIFPRSQKHFDFAKQVLESFMREDLPQALDAVFRPCFGGLEVCLRLPPTGVLAAFAQKLVTSEQDELAIQNTWIEFIEPIWDTHSKLVERLHFPDLQSVLSAQSFQVLVNPNEKGEPIFSGLIMTIAVASLYALMSQNPREELGVAAKRLEKFNDDAMLGYLRQRPQLQPYHPPFVKNAKKILEKLLEKALPGHTVAFEQYRQGGYEFFCYLPAARFFPSDKARDFKTQAEIRTVIQPMLEFFSLVVNRIRRELAAHSTYEPIGVDFSVQFGPCRKFHPTENRLDGLVFGLRFEGTDIAFTPDIIKQRDLQRSQTLIEAILDYHHLHTMVLPAFMRLPD